MALQKLPLIVPPENCPTYRGPMHELIRSAEAAEDPVALKLMPFYPLPNRAPDNITGANNFRDNYVASANANFYIVKVDHSLTDNDKLTGRYFFNGGPTRNSSV